MEITTLTVLTEDNHLETTVHASQEDAIEALRVNHCDELPEGTPLQDVLDYATTTAGCVVYHEDHEVPETYVANEPVMVTVHRENPSGRITGLSCPECQGTDILLVDIAVRGNHLEVNDGVVGVIEDRHHDGYQTAHFACARCNLKMQLDPEVEDEIAW